MSAARPVAVFSAALLGLLGPTARGASVPSPADAGAGTTASTAKPAAAPLVEALVAKHGEAQRARAEQGVRQVLAFWRLGPDGDGDEKALSDFVTSQFLADPATLERTLARFEEALEAADGHFLEIGRTWRTGAELELAPELPVDAFLAATEPAAHLQEDLFASKIAFVALLNWALPTLDQMVAQGPAWTRRQWAAARLTRRFSLRPSGAAEGARAAAAARAAAYIAGYNLWVHHLLARGRDAAVSQREAPPQPLEPPGPD